MPRLPGGQGCLCASRAAKEPCVHPPVNKTTCRRFHSATGGRLSKNLWEASEGSQVLRFYIEKRRHVRRFSCFFVRKSLLTRTNGRENGGAIRPVSECKTQKSGIGHFFDTLPPFSLGDRWSFRFSPFVQEEAAVYSAIYFLRSLAISARLMGLAVWAFMPQSMQRWMSSAKASAVMAMMGIVLASGRSSARMAWVAS